ncbi:MAG: hypothetical protein JXR37_19560 [Kiritimatiellae bacterium]|nr:hypothetical protein [Kiritimatiellia bacterium]
MPKRLLLILDSSNPSDDLLQTVYGGLEPTAAGLRASLATNVRGYLRGAPLKSLHVTIRGVGTGQGAPQLLTSNYELRIGSPENPTTGARLDSSPIAMTGRAVVQEEAPFAVSYERAGGRIRILLDGNEILNAPDPRPGLGLFDFEILFPAGALVSDVRIEGDLSEERVCPPARSDAFALSVCTDFPDDVAHHAWTGKTFAESMRFYRQNGISRVYYICPAYDDGYWDQEARAWWHAPAGAPVNEEGGYCGNVRKTYEAVGDFLPAAARAAHAEGLSFFAVLKPYESALPFGLFPEGSKEARRFGKIPRLGGPLWLTPHFTAQNPTLRVERNMGDVPEDIAKRRVGAIRLTAERGLTGRLDPSRLRLWTSANNGDYRLYKGALQARLERESPQTISLSGLELPGRFFAITVEGSPTWSFGNSLPELIEVRDTQGRLLPITFGQTQARPRADFRVLGFAFDITPVSSSIQHRDEYAWLDGGNPLGVGLGRERYLPGQLCEAYAEVQAWWLRQVEHCIASGVDGVDFRVVHHNRTYDWTSFGFNAPLVDAFRQRHGLDILREPFDYADLRRLRGERYTAFLRKARRRLREAGKAMHLHISRGMKTPEWHTESEIHFDWPAWIREDLADEVTVKTSSMRGSNSPYVAAAARPAGLKMNFCPYLNGLPGNSNGRAIMNHLVHDALDGGADGFILYENAAFMAAKADGSIRITCPWMVEMAAQFARPNRERIGNR